MANADMNRLMDNARIRLPGALDAAMKFELFSVLDEFFRATNVWKEDITFSVTPTTDTYQENPTAYTYSIVPLEDGTINRLEVVFDSGGSPRPATMSIPGEIILSSSPNEPDTFTARVYKSVKDPVTRDGYPVLPAWIMVKYGVDILDGLLGRMMSQIAKPYSNPPIAAVHLRKFKQAMNQAKAEAMHGNVYRGQRWLFPQSFSVRRRG